MKKGSRIFSIFGPMKIFDDNTILFFLFQIARYKVPRYVKFIKEFPLTVTGKVKKFELREMVKSDML